MVDGLQALTNTVTSVLNEAGEFTQSLLDSLIKVWEGATNALVPEGRTNWAAYTHKQLHEMLFDDADVGDVGTLADSWGRHSTELHGQADELRKQQTDLRVNWQGQAAELAADRLGKLHDRVSSIAGHAGEVQKAAQGAADSLAEARRTMPPPPDDATTAMSGMGGLPPLPSTPPPPGAAMTSALDSVSTGGASMYFTTNTMMGGKAQAMQVMQQYETGLLGSGSLIPDREGVTGAASYEVDGTRATTSPAGHVGGGGALGAGGGARPGGVAWHDLVGRDRLGAGGTGLGTGMATQVGEGALAEQAAARRGMSGGFAPGMGGRPGGGEDKDRDARLPTVDNQLFASDERPSLPVIGL